MREFIKKLIIWKLNVLAWMYLKKYKPTIVAVTGNVGKTSTKEAIAVVLEKSKRVRSGKGNLNNEFGVPLTIVGDWSDDYYETGNSILFWIKVLFVSFFKWFFQKDYPEILVLEYGADKPGDIKKLCKKYKPHVSVVTAIGEIPVHVEFFQSPQHLAREKSELVKCLEGNDYAVLNYNDEVVREMHEKTKAHTMTYGFADGANVRILNFNFRFDDDGRPVGVSFKIHHGGEDTFVPVKIDSSLGWSQAFAAAAAACVGLIFKINLVEISESLADYHGPNGRLKILKGIKNSTIIDDTYNASPASTQLALETIKEIVALQQNQGKKTRTLIVLGDMLELGEYVEQAHLAAGDMAGSFADILICVGLRAKFIADAAAKVMSKENIYVFDISHDARLKDRELIREGDMVLVKGSQGIRMEKIVEEIMAEPQRKKELLVRQSKKWLMK